MIKIALIWNFDKAKQIFESWKDGLRAALDEIGKTHQVDIFMGDDWKNIPNNYYDFLLFWSDANDPIVDNFIDFSGKKGIILTTDLGLNIEHLRSYDVIYCESTPVYEAVRSHGLRAIKAFGTDSNFYKPVEPDGSLVLSKDIEYFYPATFSPWKRQSSIAHLGSKLVCIGTIQPDGQAELQECLKNGVKVEQGYFPPEVIRNCYSRTHYVPIPAIHGSERTVLEAMSMNIVPTVTPANKRTNSYIEEYVHSECLSPREFILANYSGEKYAEELLRGML